MGQIFDRLKNFIKSEVNYDDNVNYDFEKQSEDDLKRIIDELNKKKETKQNTENQNNQQQDNFQKQQFSLDDAYKILEINENSNVEEIKTAYKKKIKEYHPDRLSGRFLLVPATEGVIVKMDGLLVDLKLVSSAPAVQGP